jgi:hypothetical protein
VGQVPDLPGPNVGVERARPYNAGDLQSGKPQRRPHDMLDQKLTVEPLLNGRNVQSLAVLAPGVQFGLKFRFQEILSCSIEDDFCKAN